MKMSRYDDRGNIASRAEFAKWRSRWFDQAKYQGRNVPEVDSRIETLLDLWRVPVPGNWQRRIDSQLLGQRYRRGDVGAPHNGEHRIEHEILTDPITNVRCMGGVVVDGINAMPLVYDATGGRSANVEADVLLLLRDGRSHRLALLEVKYDADNPWYAAVENLLQVKLLSANREQRRLFHARRHVALLDEDLQVVGLVVAPLEYYRSPGQKSLAVQPAQRLHDRFRREHGVDLHLATWDAVARSVAPLCW
jgi:hypothetical protein